jgi:hypothetical protein
MSTRDAVRLELNIFDVMWQRLKERMQDVEWYHLMFDGWSAAHQASWSAGVVQYVERDTWRLRCERRRIHTHSSRRVVRSVPVYFVYNGGASSTATMLTAVCKAELQRRGVMTSDAVIVSVATDNGANYKEMRKRVGGDGVGFNDPTTA